MEFKDQFVDLGEVKLHYLEGPKSGPPLVLLHGATASCHEWGTVRDALAKDWHLFMIDQRVHGQSGRGTQPADYHASHFVNDLQAFLRDVVGTPAVVWGLSWGAVVTLLSAGTAKDTMRAAVLEDPPIMVRRETCEEMKPFLGYFGSILQLKQSANSLEEVKAAIRQNFDPAGPDELINGWATTVYNVDANFLRMVLSGPEIVVGIDFAEAIRAATMPVLLLQADPEKGSALPQEDLDFVLANNPHFQLVRFPGAGHGIHIDQPEKVLETFKQFSKQLTL